ncbi:hypothetical protein [Cryobacterium sp. CG_9.6]|uniref:hypothetical protein n=1 Tax=Cryobacterium sp. CG_9.6 TaxID=2760710 RepID=UPI00247635C7|nr:hypothetical protein [Cryobacterium sp. CG_9.6]MDH6235393.1 hypothetical protein [Cryobacterium sp. CG_9.6]
MTHADQKQRSAMLRAVLATALIAALLVGALVATITALNTNVYSAGGFVGQYLNALERKDTVGALSLGGVRPRAAQLEAAGLPSDLPTTLLRASALGDLTNVTLTSDVEVQPGKHTVVYDFDLNGQPSSMRFSVESTGTFGGVFSSWRFATSPVAALAVEVQHESIFTVNGLTLDTRAHAEADAPASFTNAATYLAFAPSVYTFRHDTTLLNAAAVPVPVTKTGVIDVVVDAVPNAVFVDQVQVELNEFLDAQCITQTVLQPTGCRFGMDIDNRVLSAPTWTMAAYPEVTLTPGETSFEMPQTEGLAHLVVEVQSLFDGSIETRDEDVPFTMGLSVAIQPSGALAIQLR